MPFSVYFNNYNFTSSVRIAGVKKRENTIEKMTGNYTTGNKNNL
jgi:hypothetical protein